MLSELEKTSDPIDPIQRIFEFLVWLIDLFSISF